MDISYIIQYQSFQTEYWYDDSYFPSYRNKETAIEILQTSIEAKNEKIRRGIRYKIIKRTITILDEEIYLWND